MIYSHVWPLQSQKASEGPLIPHNLGQRSLRAESGNWREHLEVIKYITDLDMDVQAPLRCQYVPDIYEDAAVMAHNWSFRERGRADWEFLGAGKLWRKGCPNKSRFGPRWLSPHGSLFDEAGPTRALRILKRNINLHCISTREAKGCTLWQQINGSNMALWIMQKFKLHRRTPSR